jgi:hypothetical protein
MENKNNNDYYSYDLFIYKIFCSNFYNRFVSKYDKKFNYMHKNKLKESKQIHFYHLISFLYNSCIDILKNSNDAEQFTCEFCALSGEDNYLCEELVQKTATFFVLGKKDLCMMFNVLFELDLTHVQQILNRVKNNFYPDKGATAFDFNFFLYDCIKSLKRTDVEYKGLIYSQENLTSNIYQQLIHNIYNDFFVAKKKLFIIGYSTGSILNPEHWCCLFIDFNIMCLFFYNSLADNNQLCTKFFNIFIAHSCLNKLKFKIIYNENRQQQKNKICASYATNFAITMLQCDSNNREDLFQKRFNTKGNFDKFMENKQNNYIGVLNYPINTNAYYRFVYFKNILESMFKIFKK